MRKLHIHVPAALERDELEIRLLLEEIILDGPLGRQQTLIFITEAVADIKDAPRLYIRQSECLNVVPDPFPPDDHFVEGLAFEPNHRAVGMDRTPVDVTD